MRKLKLESLQVQSFATTAAASSAHGTVQAHEDPTAECLLSRDGAACHGTPRSAWRRVATAAW
jgi:hypothetical protein